MKSLRLLCLTMFVAAIAWVNAQSATSPQPGATIQDQRVTQNIGIDQRLGARLPLDTSFQDERGKTVQLGDYFKGKRPVLLVPIFYDCKGTCTLIQEAVVQAIKKMKSESVGDAFEIVMLSIRPGETPAMALERKALYLSEYNRDGAGNGWHLLTSQTEDAIRAVTNTVGFRYTIDPKTNQVNHPAGIIVLTPKGIVSQYFYGIEYPPNIVRDSLVRAGANQIGYKTPETMMFGCLQYDPVTGTYKVMIMRVLQVLCVITLAIVAGSIAVMTIKTKKQEQMRTQLGGAKGA